MSINLEDFRIILSNRYKKNRIRIILRYKGTRKLALLIMPENDYFKLNSISYQVIKFILEEQLLSAEQQAYIDAIYTKQKEILNDKQRKTEY